MKRKYVYSILLALLTLLASCGIGTRGAAAGEKEVEIEISTGSSPTRAPSEEKENQIDELDLLVFKNGQYQYMRRAYKLSNGKYRATLKVDNSYLTAEVFANCTEMLEAWDDSADKTGMTWAAVQAELIDLSPADWVTDDGSPLPMWGSTAGYVTETQVYGWTTVNMLRSVASVDVYVAQNSDTQILQLTDMHLYYAPDRGYLAPVPDDDPPGYILASPPAMQTVLNTLKASTVLQVAMDDGNGGTVQKDGIINQLYLYDNDIDENNFSPDTAPIRKYTRVILAGYYDQPSTPQYTDPANPTVDQRVKSYYPIDFVDNSTGKFRPILRNYKYIFTVVQVTGAGYPTIEDAKDNYPIDLNVNIIEWNREDIEIGVQGKYYLTMERKDALLWRYSGSTDALGLSYEILDELPAGNFRMYFKTDANGTQIPSADSEPYATVIANDYFEVTLAHDSSNSSATLTVEALQSYTGGYSTDTVVLRFRDLEFEVNITQVDSTEEDWKNGGDIDKDI